jgi:catechol 2,3-dioxygenase-like lactoylglutathione lyase family enzyme
MRVKGLDRVVIMARDIDKAVDFFSTTFDMKFKELSKPISERDGVRCFLCHETRVQLISPNFPIPDNAPPPFKKRAELLKEKEMFIMALAFEVDAPTEAAAELEERGIRIQHKYEESHDYVSIGMDNFVEVVPNDEDTFGVVMALAKYDRA